MLSDSNNQQSGEAGGPDVVSGEQRKWTKYYETLDLHPEPEVLQLGEEFRAHCETLLPDGGTILEAGCGAGWQSLALARSGRFRVDLLDFSEAALNAARRVFHVAGVEARFLTGDAFDTGEPQYDLVFNAGVIEHYTFEEQRKLLLGMASRSRRYVVVLAPNRDCYWYWISRVRNAAAGNWPFGKESPATDLRGVFEAAGLNFGGQTYLGRSWTDIFIRNLPGIETEVREVLRATHDSPLIPASQACYIVAGTGTVGAVAQSNNIEARNITAIEELAGSVSDSLALRISAESELAAERSRVAFESSRVKALQDQIESGWTRTDEAESRLSRNRLQSLELKEVLAKERIDHAERQKQLQSKTDDAESRLSRNRLRLLALKKALVKERIDHAERQKQLQSKTDDAESRLRRNWLRLLALKKALAKERIDHAEKQKHLQSKVENLYASVERFSEDSDKSQALYRTQRAWKVMLAIRRAYTMLLSQGWAGKSRWLFGPRPPLSQYELEFPVAPAYLPAPVRIPEGKQEAAPQLPSPDVRKYDVVILAIVDFDFRFQRPQQIAAEFARNGHRVFWITATRHLPEDFPEAYRVNEFRENIWEVCVRAPNLDLYRAVLSHAEVNQVYEGLQSFYRDWDVVESAVVVQLPYWRRLGLKLRQKLPVSVLVYDCMDDWDTFDNLGNFNREEEVLLAKECDLLVVTAQKLYEKFSERQLSPLLVRNGADFDFFRVADQPVELSSIQQPIAGYFGAIADWIDLDLVLEAAKARPQYTFVLAGQVFNRDTSELESLPNVCMLGSLPYHQMPGLLSAFDVCLIPFKLNQVTHATDPVKLYEYLSQGKPVVATAMDELRPWEPLMYLARGTSQFVEKLDAAFAESNPQLRESRIAFARENNWTARVSLLDSAIQEKFPKVSILIVTHNSAEFIGPCLRSLLANTSYPNWEAIVFDNASTDDTVRIARTISSGDPRIRIEALPINAGFSGGNNAAAALASGDYLLFLNADTIVTCGWIGRMLGQLLSDPSIGIVCPATNFAGNEAKINVSYSVESEMEHFAASLALQNRGLNLDVAVAALYCALIKKELFRELGGLDEGYGIGMFEDDDLSNSVKARNLRAVVAEDCFVHHFGQGSFSKIPPHEYRRIFEANRLRFEGKWKKSWVGHRTRPNVKPASEEVRFKPENFCRQPPSNTPQDNLAAAAAADGGAIKT